MMKILKNLILAVLVVDLLVWIITKEWFLDMGAWRLIYIFGYGGLMFYEDWKRKNSSEKIPNRQQDTAPNPSGPVR